MIKAFDDQTTARQAVPTSEPELAAWRRRTDAYMIGMQIALGLFILAIYSIAPHPSDANASGLFTLAIILIYIGFQLVRLAAHRMRRFEALSASMAAVVDFVLLGSLIASYQRIYVGGPALSLHAPTFAFYFVLIGLHGMRFDWRQTAAAGVSAVASWGGVVFSATLGRDDISITHSYSEFAEHGKILVGAEVERLLALIIFSTVISLTSYRVRVLSRRLRRISVQAEQARAQAEAHSLLMAKSAAERANQLKSQFLAKMSHELRTPLNGVLGFADALSGTELDETQRLYASKIGESGEALLGAITTILDVSSLEADQLELADTSFHIRQLIENIGKETAQRANEKGLACDTQIAPGFPDFLVGDSDRLRQAICHITDNAIKFTAAGRIDIRASSAPADGGGERLVVEIEDTGIGIAEAHLECIFDAFEQADNSSTRAYDGSGLGLAISRRLLEAMDGRIDVRSQQGKGSLFRLEARLASAPAHLAARPSCTELPKAPSVRRVLVADDHRINQLVVANMLEAENVQIVCVDDGGDAIEHFKAKGADIIFMDLSMPGVGGCEAARAIRAHECDRDLAPTPIIALTAHAFDSDIDECRAAGMDDFLAKPVTLAALRQAFERFTRPANGEAE